MKPVVSVIIPARNEMFLQNTIDDVLEHAAGPVEVIAILDGYWPDPPLRANPRLTVLHHAVSIGQRAAGNQGVRVAQGKFIMKLDAHCSLSEGWDEILARDCEFTDLLVPAQKNLHAFDWVCDGCGKNQYMGPTPGPCEACGHPTHHRELVWKPRHGVHRRAWLIDQQPKFRYWPDEKNFLERPEVKVEGDMTRVMGLLGACFFMHRQRYIDLGGNDEAHGSWGSQGIEMSCKSWLSGGRALCHDGGVWFAHMFRTSKDFSFPYRITAKEQEEARDYSRNLWFGNNWSGQIRPFSWLLDHFAPVPGWHHAENEFPCDHELTRLIYERGEEFMKNRHPSP